VWRGEYFVYVLSFVFVSVFVLGFVLLEFRVLFDILIGCFLPVFQLLDWNMEYYWTKISMMCGICWGIRYSKSWACILNS
jgi:hypothetical protein